MSISLRVKKYRISTSFGSWAMNAFAPCSWGRRMFTPKDRSRPAPSVPGRHDPWPRPGHDHPALGRELAREVPRQHVDRVLGRGARRAEHRDLAHVAPGAEHLEGLRHLLERGVDDLQVERVAVDPGEVDHGLEHRDDEVALLARQSCALDELVDDGLDALVQRRHAIA